MILKVEEIIGNQVNQSSEGGLEAACHSGRRDPNGRGQ
jgi:hypothetical protein